MGRVWRASCACLLRVSGVCLVRVGRVSGSCLVRVWCVSVFFVCLARVWRVSGACLARGACAEGVWNVHGASRA
jgi:hypothetical protein